MSTSRAQSDIDRACSCLRGSWCREQCLHMITMLEVGESVPTAKSQRLAFPPLTFFMRLNRSNFLGPRRIPGGGPAAHSCCCGADLAKRS